MSKPDSKFLFVADDPCLDFLNTVVVEKGELVDRLETFQDLVEWLKESPLGFTVSPSLVRKWKRSASAKRTLEELKHFRGVLANMVSQLVAGKPVPESALQMVNKYLTLRKGHPVVERTSRGFHSVFKYTPQSPQELLAPIAETAAHLLSHADFSLIKKCENGSCVLHFYDTTRNHARRWCSMTACGNRHKVAAYYERLRKNS